MTRLPFLVIDSLSDARSAQTNCKKPCHQFSTHQPPPQKLIPTLVSGRDFVCDFLRDRKVGLPPPLAPCSFTKTCMPSLFEPFGSRTEYSDAKLVLLP